MWLKAAGAAATALFGGLLLRGKTAKLNPLTDANAASAAKAICEAFDGAPPDYATTENMARAVAKAAYTQDAEGVAIDLDWPPGWLADSSHRAVWDQLLAWCESVRLEAGLAGVTICEYLSAGDLPPILPPATGQGPLLPPGQEPPTLGPDLGLAPGPDPTTPEPTAPGPGLGLAPGSVDAMPGNPSGTPTPGRSYDIKLGDSFLGVTKKAYGLEGSANLAASKIVNNNPINRANATYMQPEIGTNEANWYPNGRISFSPPFQRIFFPELV
jgi:hypothetical protein